ncbi:hypothetical protein GOQ27_06920 [Clostridium sp. D2Q-11]|uniref:Uncharacterized protein n=1 Tax=Anaeromonas frigoriresistens TaxID=2683708 RepID=A0A942US69_9FIRM|nr:hypothetical protein [Anaeromonas frigoriresistens]MBS4538188.1 hypothetical protein [Anaeromonas frigoriresistens]
MANRDEIEDKMSLLLMDIGELKREVRIGDKAKVQLILKRKELNSLVKQLGGEIDGELESSK